MNSNSKNKILWLMLLLLFVVNSSHATEYSSSDLSKCEPFKNEKDNVTRIDANTGRIKGGAIFYPRRTQVGLIFTNKNPYKYIYDFKVDSVAIEDGILGYGLQLLGVNKLVDKLGAGAEGQDSAISVAKDLDEVAKKKEVAEKAKAAEGKQGLAFVDNSCPLKKEMDRTLDSIARYVTTRKQIEEEMKALGKLSDRHDYVVKDLVSDWHLDGKNTCDSKFKVGNDAEKDLKSLLERKRFKKLVMDFNKNSKSIVAEKKALADSAKSKPGSESKCKEELEIINLALDELIDDAKSRVKKYDEFESQVKSKEAIVKDTMKLLSDVRNSEDAFESLVSTPINHAPTRYDVEIIRSDRVKTDKKEAKTIVVPSITAGKSRFSVSAGVGISNVKIASYGKQKGLVGEGEMVGTVVAVSEEENQNISAVVQINGSLSESWDRVSFNWSLGAMLTADSDTNSISYFTGPSIGLIDDQMFLTFGYHSRKSQTLGGGFSVGDVVPETMTEDLPVSTKTTSGLLFTVTYKIK